MSQPPAGWIPPKYRRFIYRRLTDAEIDEARQSMQIMDENGTRVATREEFIRATNGCEVVGVEDTRSGKKYPKVSKGVKFIDVDFDL